jgi:hypothetical protein
LVNEFGGQGELGVIGDDEAGSVFENQVHLSLAGMDELDLDKGGRIDRPGFGGFGCRHSRKMKPTQAPHQIRLGVVFPTLTLHLVIAAGALAQHLQNDHRLIREAALPANRGTHNHAIGIIK